MGLARMGPVQQHVPGLARLGQRTAWYPYATPSDLSATYTGTLDPFYAGTHAYWNDPTLKYQAPRPSTGNPLNPSSHAWFDETLTLQAERGGLYGPDLNAATQMSTGAKVMVGVGVGVALIGAGLLVFR